MSAPFIPLSLSLGRSENRGKNDLNSGEKKESERKVFLPASAPPALASEPSFHAGHAQPKLIVQREGEKISGIRIECSCGQIIEVACQY